MDTFLEVVGLFLAILLIIAGGFILAEYNQIIVTTDIDYFTNKAITETVINWPGIATGIGLILSGAFVFTISFVAAYAYEKAVKILKIVENLEKELNKETKEDEEPKVGEEKANI